MTGVQTCALPISHNLSKGTSVTNGNIQIYGGDTFYLSADLLLTGSYASGNLYGSVGKTWRTLVLTTGDSKQDIGCLLYTSMVYIASIKRKERNRSRRSYIDTGGNINHLL